MFVLLLYWFCTSHYLLITYSLPICYPKSPHHSSFFCSDHFDHFDHFSLYCTCIVTWSFFLIYLFTPTYTGARKRAPKCLLRATDIAIHRYCYRKTIVTGTTKRELTFHNIFILCCYRFFKITEYILCIYKVLRDTIFPRCAYRMHW